MDKPTVGTQYKAADGKFWTVQDYDQWTDNVIWAEEPSVYGKLEDAIKQKGLIRDGFLAAYPEPKPTKGKAAKADPPAA